MAKKDKDVDGLAKKAASLMKEKKCNCAEAIIRVMAKRFGFDPDLAKMGTPFGGGISNNGDLCGLLTGGLIVIGLRFGRSEYEDLETKNRCYAIGSEYYNWFMGRFGRCTDLKGNSRTIPYDVCFDAAEQAVPYLIALLEKNDKKGKKITRRGP